MNLTLEETKAIKSLQRLAKKWPKSLWLYSASGTLNVMKTNKKGEHAVVENGSIDPYYLVGHIQGISNDGGDW